MKKEKIKIFFSYGHDENQEIVHLLADRLKSNSKYDVWIDSDKIKQGNDWRMAIENGIQSCDQFIAFMSEYSMRDKGVCHDELQIGLCVRGVDIKTVLMEDQEKVNPPSIFCHRQWIDMSGWREAKSKGAEVFQNWLNEKYNELLDVLENTESIEFKGDIKYISNKLEISLSDVKLFELMKQNYTPITRLEEKINEWLVEDSTPICVLYGGAGSGKSIFSANQTFINPSNLFVLFCDKKYSADQDCKIIMKQIILKLCIKLPNYRKSVKFILEREEEKEKEESRTEKKNYSAEELLDKFIIEPLNNSIDGGISTFYMLIDGLDEAGVAAIHFSRLLVSRVNRFPSWIRLLITSRENKDIQSIMIGEQILELNMEDYNGQAIKDMIISFGIENFDTEDISKIEEASEGCAFYAKLLCEDIKNGKVTKEDLKTIPKGIYQYYLNEFNNLFKRECDYWDAKELLNILCIGFYVPQKIIRNIVPNCDEIIAKFNGLVVENRFLLDMKETGFLGEDVVNIHADSWKVIHNSLVDWLTNPSLSGKFCVNSYKGISVVAKYCLDKYKNTSRFDIGENTGFDFEENEEILFVKKNLCLLLVEAEMWDDYCSLLDSYIEKFRTSRIDLGPYIVDYSKMSNAENNTDYFENQDEFDDKLLHVDELKDLFRYIDRIPLIYDIEKYLLEYKTRIVNSVMEYDYEKGYKTPDFGRVMSCLENIEIYTERFLPCVFRWIFSCFAAWEACKNNSSYSKEEIISHMDEYLLKMSARGIELPASIKIEYDYYRGITSERMEIDEKKEGWWFNIDVYNCNELNGVC